MSTPDPWSLVAEGYAAETQPLFAQYCQAALRAANFQRADRVLDCACGPGTMSLLIRDDASEIDCVDFSPPMVELLNREIIRHGIRNITPAVMDGQQLEFADGTFDWAFSIFGLMFFPDRERGFKELLRTLKPDGRAVVTAWGSLEHSSLMQAMMGATQEAFPSPPTSSKPKPAPGLDDPENFRTEMERAGFVDVVISSFDGEWPVEEIETFFEAMVRGTAPLTLLRCQLGESGWAEKREIMLGHLHGRLQELPTVLHSRALIGVGTKPRSQS